MGRETGPVVEQPKRARTPARCGVPRCARLGARSTPPVEHLEKRPKRERRTRRDGCLCARGTRTVKLCSSDARTLGRPTPSS